MRLVLGLFRAGWVAYFMSQPMLMGFVPAAAVLIASSQLPKALGASAPGYSNDIANAGWTLIHPGSWNLAAIGVTALSIAVIFGGRRIHALFPGVLVAAIVGIAVSAFRGLSR